jgi:signal transduction histidine kinase
MKSKSVKSNNPLKSVIQTDIVKAHVGEIILNSNGTNESQFMIKLPLNK